jgi:hypothetical protein
MDPAVSRALDAFVASAKAAFGEDLRCVALFGSAAEDRLRATSDINVALVLARFAPAAAEQLREPLALAWTTIRLQAMFLLESELADAAGAFAVKFSDIARRHRVLHGPDLFAAAPPRAAVIAQLRQSTLGEAMRLREQYVDQGLHEERLARMVADAAGPLRACAAALLELEGRPAESPRSALEAVAGGELPELRRAREEGRLPAGTAGPAMLRLLELAETLARRARELR